MKNIQINVSEELVESIISSMRVEDLLLAYKLVEQIKEGK